MAEEMLEMKEVYHELENWQKYYVKEEEKYKKLFERAKKNKEAIELSMASLEDGDFSPITVDISIDENNFVTIEEKVEEKKKEEEKEAKQPKWTKLSPGVVQFDPNGNVMGKYISQTAFAKYAGLRQPTVCHIMKQAKDLQIARYGYYLEWQH